MFNIIDSSRGEKADLVPLTMDIRYWRAFQYRIRQTAILTEGESLTVWCARPEDVIVGKLMAWAEGQSRRHETDIFEMMVFNYSGIDPALSANFDDSYVTTQAIALGPEVANLWKTIKAAARQAAD